MLRFGNVALLKHENFCSCQLHFAFHAIHLLILAYLTAHTSQCYTETMMNGCGVQEMDRKYGMLAKRYDRLRELTTIVEKLKVSMQLSKVREREIGGGGGEEERGR